MQEKTEPSYYIVIPCEILEDPKLSMGSKIVYGLITGLSDPTGVCEASTKYLARRISMSSKGVSNCIKMLISAQYICVRKNSNGRRIYLMEVKA